MSKAFTREDIDPPERPGRLRSTSGLPPGAVNYITKGGAQRLQDELAKLRGGGDSKERVAELERILASVTIVDPPEAPSDSVAFGALVTVEDAEANSETFRVVGVDEVDFEPDAVSWVSAIGKALLAGELGQRIIISGDKSRVVRIVKVQYPAC